MTGPVNLPAITISGTTTLYGDTLVVAGIGDVALLIDAGGTAVFEAASAVTLDSNVIIGNAAGAGTLDVATDDFQIGTAGSSTNLVIASNSLAAGSLVEIDGDMTVAGTLVLGASAAARLDLSGDLAASATTIGMSGTLIASTDAKASFGGLVDAGTLMLENDTQAEAANLILTGVLQMTGQSALTGLSSAVIGSAGSLIVGSGAAFSAGALNALGGGISIAGSLQVAGNLVSDAVITLAGGTLDAAAVTLGSGGVLSGFGDVVLNAGSKILGSGGDIVARGGLLVLDGSVTVSNGGSAAIDAGASLELMSSASGALVFSGSNAELIINDLAGISASVSGMVGHDVIDLASIAPSLVSYSGGVISAKDTGGHPIGSLSLNITSGQSAVEIVADGSGGALVTLGDELACFAGGTRLLTPNGYVPVEAFKPGDPIITHAGVKLPVRWIGHRVIEPELKARANLSPVVVMPGALGPGIPSQEVRLSPSHAVFLDDVLVPVMHLVNGATIIRERNSRAVAYYHIELDRHAVVMADRLPVETYLDTGNRGQFPHEAGLRGQASQTCAPLVTNGLKLARIRRRLHDMALKAGFSTVHEPRLYAIVRDLKLLPEILPLKGTRVARFTLPTAVERIMLVAQTAPPADTDPDSDDRRELGICLRLPRTKGKQLRLGAGWYEKATGDTGTWMGSSGELFVPRDATQLTLHLAAVAQSWRPPPAIDL